MPALILNRKCRIVGAWVNHSVCCFEHWDNRRNPRKYQPALEEDLKQYPCKKCRKTEEA